MRPLKRRLTVTGPSRLPSKLYRVPLKIINFQDYGTSGNIDSPVKCLKKRTKLRISLSFSRGNGFFKTLLWSEIWYPGYRACSKIRI